MGSFINTKDFKVFNSGKGPPTFVDSKDLNSSLIMIINERKFMVLCTNE